MLSVSVSVELQNAISVPRDLMYKSNQINAHRNLSQSSRAVLHLF